jgi:HSP20 family protein
MNVIRYAPWGFVTRFQTNLDHLIGASAASGDESRAVASDWQPAVDIKEEANGFVIHADVPGVEPKDIDVTLDKGVLSIRGQRHVDAREVGDGHRRVERLSGQFFRRFSLPDTAAPEGVEARYVNGVLEVRIPKQPQVQPRRIEVAAA